jgi:hypothetical protein
MMKLTQPILVFNIDGTANTEGSISEVAELLLHYNGHSKRALFCVTRLGRQNLILGHTWLKDHNPEVDWRTGKVEMSHCSVLQWMLYLGLIILENQVEMDPVKVAGVAEWPEPSNKWELQSFLGFANFYHQFIKDFSHHTCPLFNLTKNEQKWQWTPSEASAFKKLKELVTSAPVLTTPADDQPFRIEADSSNYTTGAVLSQLSTEDGKWHLVAYYSKSLSETEWNYEIHNKEMLAIIRALDKWRHFLEGAPHKVEIWTDHKNLGTLCQLRNSTTERPWVSQMR